VREEKGNVEEKMAVPNAGSEKPGFCEAIFTSWYDVSHGMGFRV